MFLDLALAVVLDASDEAIFAFEFFRPHKKVRYGLVMYLRTGYFRTPYFTKL